LGAVDFLKKPLHDILPLVRKLLSEKINKDAQKIKLKFSYYFLSMPKSFNLRYKVVLSNPANSATSVIIRYNNSDPSFIC
jgi:hypothetical protein